MIRPPFYRIAWRSQGMALVIVLGFIVLVTGLVLAFFSRALSERQISNGSANQVKADLFAQGAAETIIGDLRQEAAAGSTITTLSTGGTILIPKTAQAAVPAIVGVTSNSGGLNNLVKRSAYQQPFYANSGGATTPYDTTAYPPPGNASDVTVRSRAAGPHEQSSSQVPALNGRFISPDRWNKALLMAKQSPTVDGTTPTGDFVPPDWVLVARDGKNPTVWNSNMVAVNNSTTSVVGRYAYNVYDEGGLLDANVAGYPTDGSGKPDAGIARKSALAFADLTQLPGIKDLTPYNQRPAAVVNSLVGWRNYASIKAVGSGNLASGYTFSPAMLGNFTSVMLGNADGFLSVSNVQLTPDRQSDRKFASRQELINLLTRGVATGGTERASLQNALQYLGTFSRDLNQPSYIPAVQQPGSNAPVVLDVSLGGNTASGGDQFVNPSFLSVRVPNPFFRKDGSPANVGDPLVNKRFPLQRLAWITYKGPSASRNQTDPDIQAVINNGIPWSYLQLGTKENISYYFGLAWDDQHQYWLYNVNNGGASGKGIIMLVGRPGSTTTPDATKYVQDTKREADFFELLKAGITVGSLGKTAVNSATAVGTNDTPKGYDPKQVPANFRYSYDSSVDYHIIQIGANILNEVNPTSYPVRIVYDDGSARGPWEFQGVTDLPYLSYVFNGVLRTQRPNPDVPARSAVDTSPYEFPAAQKAALTSPGDACMIQVPAVWNPYDPNGTAGVLRPGKFRIVVDSNDPTSLSGVGNLPIWHGAEAESTTVAGTNAGSNQGVKAPHATYSFNASGIGQTSEKPQGTGTSVNDAVTFDDGKGTLYREPTIIFSTKAPGNATRANASASNSPATDITSVDQNPLPGESDGLNGPWAPLVLGHFPLAFAGGTPTAPLTYYSGVGLIGLAAGLGDNRVYFTYRLQYEYPAGSNQYVTYDTKYGRTTPGRFWFQCDLNGNGNFSMNVIKAQDRFVPFAWAAAIDPRTARFGLISDTQNTGRSFSGAVAPPGGPTPWIFDASGITTTIGITNPIRPDNSSGFYFANLDNNNVPAGGNRGGDGFAMLTSLTSSSTRDIPYPSFSAGWTMPGVTVAPHGASDIWAFAPGLYTQNNCHVPFSTGVNHPSYYADADGVVRRAAGAYVPPGSLSTVGLPTASIQGYTNAPQTIAVPTTTPATTTPYTQAQSRPLLLHRPFRTVAELGYVFRDLPWKNLDFCTPESGDAALLDLFCTNETSDLNGLVAGKLNLNTRQAPALAAVISGACVDDPKVSNATVGSVSSTVSSSIANALVSRTADAANYGSLRNLAELVGQWKAAVAPNPGLTYSPSLAGANCNVDLPSPTYKDGKLSYTGFSGIFINGTTAATSPPEDLSSAYTTISDALLQTSVSQIERFREAPIRALAAVGQTRVWNMMIDVVAQTGRYPSTAANAANPLSAFVVEGEQRYWVHVAIDRLTGQVIDKQIEVVKE